MEPPIEVDYLETVAAIARVHVLVEELAAEVSSRKLAKAAEILDELHGHVIQRLTALESAYHRN